MVLFVISPAKTLDETSAIPKLATSMPELLDDAQKLVHILRKKSPDVLRSMMGISQKLADVNYQRFQDFHTPFTAKNARPALLTFKGDVYAPMQVAEYGKKEWAYATQHLRILSGLYGVLRPLDLMQPYRLEMGTALANSRGKNLYDFWSNRISITLNKALRDAGSETLVNLASQEYFKAVDVGNLQGKILHIAFKESHRGMLQVIGIHAKRARGLMVDFAIREHIARVQDLKEFTCEGYQFSRLLSQGDSWVFVRA